MHVARMQVRDGGGGDARAVLLRVALQLRGLHLRGGAGGRSRGEGRLQVRPQLHVYGVPHVRRIRQSPATSHGPPRCVTVCLYV